MVLYTIIDPEFVISAPDKEIGNTQVIDYEGVKLEVIPEADKTYTVSRIISTDPADYLKPLLQPGTKIQLTPTIKDH